MAISKSEFLAKVAEILGCTPDQFSDDPLLDKFPEWGSLAEMSMLVMVEETCDMTLSAGLLRRCRRVSDLLQLVGDKVQG